MNLQSITNYSYTEAISKHRTYLMGGAMLMVLVYHAFCWVYNPIGRLNIGYIGVDIFLLLSGYGLGISYQKNKLSTFYKNRLRRVYPAYAVSVCLAFIFLYKDWGIEYLFHNLTTLGFYLDGGLHRFDWYLESLFTLYLLFPLFYSYAKRKLVGLSILFFAVASFLAYQPVSWWYDCLIARLPIFVLGIMLPMMSTRKLLLIAILGVILYYPTYAYSSVFLASSLLSVALVLFMASNPLCKYPKAYQCLQLLGEYSLEIYLSNVLVYFLFEYCALSILNRALLYIPLEVAFTLFLIASGSLIDKLRSKH